MIQVCVRLMQGGIIALSPSTTDKGLTPSSAVSPLTEAADSQTSMSNSE